MKKTLAILGVFGLAVTFATTVQPIQAATDYSPSISINSQKLSNGQAVPNANIDFVVQHVELTKYGDFDPLDFTTFETKNISSALIMTTDNSGKALLDNVNLLRKGWYLINETGQKPVLLSFPFRDETGQLKDDLYLQPKNDLVKPNTNSGIPTNTVNNTDLTQNINRYDPKQKTAGKILQTSGMASYNWLMVMIGSILALFFGLIAFIKKTDTKSE